MSSFYMSCQQRDRQTDKQTDRQTPVKHNLFGVSNNKTLIEHKFTWIDVTF